MNKTNNLQLARSVAFATLGVNSLVYVFSVRTLTSPFWNKNPFAGKVDKKPTVQGLRHTFVVDKMNEWMETGVDTAVMMPYLSRYLGHSSISETQYYYHAIEQAFPIIRRRDAVARSIIPEVVTYEE